MKLDQATITWIERTLDEIFTRTGHGEVGLIYHIRDGKIEWTEKIKRETEKSKKPGGALKA